MTENVLLTGFPSSNPILNGLHRLLNGDNIEEVLFERDQALPTPQMFLSHAWEALIWLKTPSVEAISLMEQMVFVIKSLPNVEQMEVWGVALPVEVEAAWLSVFRNSELD